MHDDVAGVIWIVKFAKNEVGLASFFSFHFFPTFSLVLTLPTFIIFQHLYSILATRKPLPLHINININKYYKKKNIERLEDEHH